jgi:rhamnosyltransferase
VYAGLGQSRIVNHMAKNERTSAIVVTFHPRTEYLENLAKIRDQVDLLIVVDNGSNENELAQIRFASREPGFKLIANGDNLGIAAALNLGVREAQKEGCRWVALFDQDSVVTEGFIATMIADFRTYSQQRKIMQIIPEVS